jgi:hypothetical protein
MSEIISPSQKEKISLRKRWKKLWESIESNILNSGAQKVDLKADENLKEDSVNTETLGQNGKDFPEKINYDNPPSQIVLERLSSARETLTRLYGEKLANEVLDNIRYVDEESFNKGLDQIAEHLNSLNDKPIIFLHYGRQESKQALSVEEMEKSGQWLSHEIKSRLPEQRVKTIIEIKAFLVRVRSKGKKGADYLSQFQLVVADDIVNSGEQIHTRILEKLYALDQELGTDLLSDVVVGSIASSDLNDTNKFLYKKIKKLVRVFKNFKIGDIPNIEQTWQNQRIMKNSIQFYYHKVPDYFFSDLLRSRHGVSEEVNGEKRNIWLVDDMEVAPPYEPHRFTTGNWTGTRRHHDQNNPRIPSWIRK